MARGAEQRPEEEGQGIGRISAVADVLTLELVPPDPTVHPYEIFHAYEPGASELNKDGVNLLEYTAGMGTKTAAERLRADNRAREQRMHSKKKTLANVGELPQGPITSRESSRIAKQVRRAQAAIASISEGRSNTGVQIEEGDPVSLKYNMSGVPDNWGDVNLDGDNYPGLMISGVASNEYAKSAQAAEDIEIALSEAQPDVAPFLGIAREKVIRSEERRGMFASGILRQDQDPNRSSDGNARSHDGRSWDQKNDGMPIGRPVIAGIDQYASSAEGIVDERDLYEDHHPWEAEDGSIVSENLAVSGERSVALGGLVDKLDVYGAAFYNEVELISAEQYAASEPKDSRSSGGKYSSTKIDLSE